MILSLFWHSILTDTHTGTQIMMLMMVIQMSFSRFMYLCYLHDSFSTDTNSQVSPLLGKQEHEIVIPSNNEPFEPISQTYWSIWGLPIWYGILSVYLGRRGLLMTLCCPSRRQNTVIRPSKCHLGQTHDTKHLTALF